MSGGLTVRLLVIIACTLATIADCARPLEDDELSTVILRLLETSEQISSHHLSPPQLSPAHRTVENMFTLYRKPPSPIEEYKFKSDSIDESSEESSVTKASPRMEFDRNAEQLQRRQYTYNSVLHKNPAGPNPIGNEYRPGNTMHNVKKYRYPPQG